MSQLIKLESDQQNEPKIWKQKDIIKLRVEINEWEIQKTIWKINESKNWFLEKINKINKSLEKLTKKEDKLNKPNWKWKWEGYYRYYRNSKGNHKLLWESSCHKTREPGINKYMFKLLQLPKVEPRWSGIPEHMYYYWGNWKGNQKDLVKQNYKSKMIY